MNLTLLNIFRIGKSAVQLFPANPEYPCLQPQTFRVLQKQKGIEVGTDTWGAVYSDKDTPFFFSRQWHESAYSANGFQVQGPVVTMYEIVSEAQSSAFAGNGFKRCHTIEISVLDTYHEDCTKGDQIGCKARPANQIFIDTGIILDSILQYFGGMVVATTSAEPSEALYYLPWLEYQKANVPGFNFTVKTNLQNSLSAANEKMRFSRVELSATQKIFGTYTQFRFCTNNCPVIEYDTSLEDFGLLSFEAGCRDCQ